MIVKQEDSVVIYSPDGKIIYLQEDLTQLHRYTQEHTLAVSPGMIGFIRCFYDEVTGDKAHVIVKDNKFKSVVCKDFTTIVYREIGMPVIDLYDRYHNNFARFQIGKDGEWIYIVRKLMPVIIKVKEFKDTFIHGTHKGKAVVYDTKTRRLRASKGLKDGIVLTTLAEELGVEYK